MKQTIRHRLCDWRVYARCDWLRCKMWLKIAARVHASGKNPPGRRAVERQPRLLDALIQVQGEFSSIHVRSVTSLTDSIV